MIYPNHTTMTKEELFLYHAPDFNFELSADELLQHALAVGFVTETGNNEYLINYNY